MLGEGVEINHEITAEPVNNDMNIDLLDLDGGIVETKKTIENKGDSKNHDYDFFNEI